MMKNCEQILNLEKIKWWQPLEKSDWRTV